MCTDCFQSVLISLLQELKGALCYQDPDGDGLLHIVILHMDLAKIYALVEQMLKAEDTCTRRAFDMPNRAHETPLHLAVRKNSPEIVAYLVEAGANPNHRTVPPGQQTPLHHAASHGMTEVVEVIFPFILYAQDFSNNNNTGKYLILGFNFA